MDNEQFGSTNPPIRDSSRQAEASSSTAPASESITERVLRLRFWDYFTQGVFLDPTNPITDKNFTQWNHNAEYYYQHASITMAKALFKYWDHLTGLAEDESIADTLIDGAFEGYIGDLVRGGGDPELAAKVRATGNLTNVFNSVGFKDLIWDRAVAIKNEIQQLENENLELYYSDPKFVETRWLDLAYFHLLEHDRRKKITHVLQNPIAKDLVRNLDGITRNEAINSQRTRYIIKKECDKLRKNAKWS